MARPSAGGALAHRGRLRITVVACVGLLLALAGARTAIGEPGRIDLLLSLAINLGVVWTCMADARLLGRPLPLLIPLALFFTWPLSLPFYFVWSRGWLRGLVLSVACLVAFFLLVGVSYTIAGYLVHGAAFFETA